MDKYYIPKHIDDPARIVFFTIDEAALIAFVMIVSLALGYELIGLLLAIAAYYFYKTLKGKEGPAFIKKYMYWNFNLGSRHLIPSASIRKYKG